METEEVKQILYRYFEGTSTAAEENVLESYFRSDKIDEELIEYKEFFTGISELSGLEKEKRMEDEIMDFLLESELKEKTRHRRVWQLVTGIAASVIIAVGGMLFYQQGKQQVKDTFNNPEAAYICAAQTLEYVAAKYNKGMAPLAGLNKLESAARPLATAAKPVNEYLKIIERFKEE